MNQFDYEISIIFILGLWITPVPSFKIILIRIHLFSLDCLPHFIHILNFPSNLNFPLFLNFCRNISPKRRYFPKLCYKKVTLTVLPLLAVTMVFLVLAYLHFDISIVSKVLSITKYKKAYKYVILWQYSKKKSLQIECKQVVTFFMVSTSNQLFLIYFSINLSALIIFNDLSFQCRILIFNHYHSMKQINNFYLNRTALLSCYIISEGRGSINISDLLCQCIRISIYFLIQELRIVFCLLHHHENMLSNWRIPACLLSYNDQHLWQLSNHLKKLSILFDLVRLDGCLLHHHCELLPS